MIILPIGSGKRLLLCMTYCWNCRPGRVKTYVDAVVASAMMNDSSSIMQYVVRSEMQGLSLDSLFTGIDVLSRSIGQSGIYEQVLLLVKEQQPWFTRVTE